MGRKKTAGSFLKKHTKLLVGILCAAAVIAVGTFAVYLDTQSPEPVLGFLYPEWVFTKPGSQIGPLNPVPDEPIRPPEDLPPAVVIPEVNFPFEIPEHGLMIHRLAPYEGLFVEDGTNIQVPTVAMLLVENKGQYPVEYTRISLKYEDTELIFDISALPVGERLVVQEKTCKPVPEGKPSSANAMVVYGADMNLANDKIKVTDNGNDTLTIQNLTEEMIPTVRVFYKYYMEDQNVFVGGIAFTVRITRLGAEESITIKPTHYNSQTGRVVMVLTYDSEV